MIEGIRRKLTSVLANEATDKAVMFVEEFYTKGRDELIFSASAFYLLPRKAEKKGPTT